MHNPKELALRYMAMAKELIQVDGALHPAATIVGGDGVSVCDLGEPREWNDPTHRERACFWLRRFCREHDAKAIITVSDSNIRVLDDETLQPKGLTFKQFVCLPQEQQFALMEELREHIRPCEAVHVAVETVTGCYSIIQKYRRWPSRIEFFDEPIESEQPQAGRFSGFIKQPSTSA